MFVVRWCYTECVNMFVIYRLASPRTHSSNDSLERVNSTAILRHSHFQSIYSFSSVPTFCFCGTWLHIFAVFFCVRTEKSRRARNPGMHISWAAVAPKISFGAARLPFVTVSVYVFMSDVITGGIFLVCPIKAHV
jgi:hypothetical protein